MATIPRVFDRDLIAEHLRRRNPATEDFVTELALEDLASRLITITRDFQQALIIAPEGSRLPLMGRSARGAFAFERASTVAGSPDAPLVDPELLELPRTGYDLIVSLFDLQVINDVPGYLSRLRAHLRPDGLIIAAALGGDTLTELRQAFLHAESELTGGAFARVAPFIPLADAGGLLQRAGLALPVTDLETYPVRYGDALRLMRELKGLGAQNPLADRPARLATRTLIAAAAAAYAEIAGDADGRVRATLEIIWLLGWAPHESQQKPLRRGSATVRLGDVLGKSE
ncbi:MAG: SAM-dependent methyltransferase [Devosia sp.]